MKFLFLRLILREFETQFEKHGFSLSTHKSGKSSVSHESIRTGLVPACYCLLGLP